MTWLGSLTIAVSSVFLAKLAVWLDEHFKEPITCEKCGHVQGEEKK